MVCTVETRGLDEAGTWRRLNKQPDYPIASTPAATSRTPAIQDRGDRRAGRMEHSYAPASELLARAENS